MAERIKLLTQKRTSFKTQITTLSNALDRGKIDNATLKLRIARVTELYHNFEENNDELMILDPENGHMAEFSNIQERFYDLAGRIERIINVNDTPGTSSNASIDAVRDDSSINGTGNTRRRMKLPQASLPTFDGKYENWLSFKNAFNNMVGSQSDLSDMDKLHYLQSALKGEAASKIKILAVEGSSYSSAWKLLERSYEVRRILISRHLASIINSPALDKETTSGLTKLADDAQQHIASLNSLGVTVGEEIVVHILESKLPKSALEKWETTLDRDEFPKLEKMFEFLYKIAVCASRRERSKVSEPDKLKGEPPLKKRREDETAVSKATSLATISHFVPQLLTSALVDIRDSKHNVVQCRVLLDTCATANFISESIVKQLNVRIVKQSLPIGAINAMNTMSKGTVEITIHSRHNDFSKTLTCLVIPSITDRIPADVFPRERIKIPPNIKLADPYFHIPNSIDLLIGSGATLSLFSIGQINLSRNGHDLLLQKTRLGWVIVGSASAQTHRDTAMCQLTSLEIQLRKFWEIEEVTTDKPRSEEEIECERHFMDNVSRNETGRYTVRLPFRKNVETLGESKAMALKRLASLERKLDADETLKNEYTHAIEEHLRLGHMTVVKDVENNGYYMPHHAVVKETSNTTKVRVVFDASAKTSSGISLNEALMVGPTIQSKLFDHLMRFRTYNYVLTADIEKMYCQVRLHEDDRQFQRILWRVGERVETLQFNTLTFGVASSPFLAIRVIRKLADDEGHMYPRAAKIIKAHLYVDDLLTGAETVEEARVIRDEIIALLARGGFNIRQWASNDEQTVNDLPEGALHASFVMNIDHSLKTLGIAWNARDDKMQYSVRSIKNTEKITKRIILAEIARIFDPLGLLGPVILHAKRMMQDIWRCELHWDESVPQNINSEWLEFTRQLESMGQISLERKLLVENCLDIQYHGFCDASTVGYGACLYVRSTDKLGKTIIRLACSKSRVAPLKTTTIPRLELCGALLLARLYREASAAMGIEPSKIIFWCDSTIVLHWLRTAPHLLKTYVANRVVEIQETVKSNVWRHVGSADNPADAISRGQLPRTFLQNQIWFQGPSWLGKGEAEWPNEIMQIDTVPELKRNTCLLVTPEEFDVLDRYSSYSKLLRVVAYCLRWRSSNKHTGLLNAREIDTAEIRVLKLVQASRFTHEIQKLQQKEELKGKSKIINLSPFLDENGLIRVGGRLRKSSLTFAQKHPILLPTRHPLTDRVIKEIHEMHHHTSIQSTLYILRQRFWITDGRNQVRRIVRACTRCFRFHASATEYKMGDLPSFRVREAPPFANTGVDFCGPFYVKERKHRNRTRVKAYVCVFVCLSIKAVHLELVSDLSTDGFIAALRRFVARRGLPNHIYSDNGTNFVGANNQLKEMYALFNSEQHKDKINHFSSERRINWHFIPPFAPHFGGLWEATVKLFKHHFKRVVGDSLFTFEELNTFVTEVESILNSRPIVSLTSDPNDSLALSPAHYLIGKPLTTLPEGDMTCVPANRLSTWQHIVKVRQDFWSRWNLEYLNELQMRSKWTKDGTRLEAGTVVLIKSRGMPCSQWALGKIMELHSGDDGVPRVATIKTANGTIKRATRLLCKLPTE